MDIQLGLCDPPNPIYLYVGQGEENGQSYLWYRYDIDAQKQYPIFQRGLTGYLTELRITTKEYKGKDNHKLDIVMRCDRIYIIRSGVDTNFSKTLLLALEAVPDITKPLTIAVAPGEETVVFCRVYDATTGARIKAEWNPQAPWLDIVAQLSERLVGTGLNEVSSLKTGSIKGKQETQSHNTDNTNTPINTNKKSVYPCSTPSRALKEAGGKNTALPELYPEHNTIIKAIRTRTGHTPDSIKLWLEQYNATRPDQVEPAICRLLADDLALSWGEPRFRTPEHCQTSYRGKVEMLLASGTGLGDAILAWIDSVETAVVSR